MQSRFTTALRRETETDKKLLAWLERNSPWLMKLDSTKVMWRVGLELNHGRLLGRSVDESLLVAAGELRKVYEDGAESNAPKTASPQEEDDDQEEGDEDGK